MDTLGFMDAYASVLKSYVESREEQYLAIAANLGREILLAGVPPEEIAEIHEEAIQRFAEEFPDKTLLESVQRVSAPLMEMLMAYGLAFREQQHERKRAEEALKALTKSLERRTAELEVANEELEAFTYSVSHDLRAPLRGIDGFSKALIEDYGDVLQDGAIEYLTRVRMAAQRMGLLIDDLLKLARTARGELAFEEVNLSAVVQVIATELAEREPERVVTFEIAPDLIARSDSRLLKVVLDNLLDNAWKFTGKHKRAKIEFGASIRNGETAYSVRDDGAGFDMAYAHKLFTPFQRLHGVTEFDGTGVGLATVARIVHRHGGRVWAEGAAVEKGATFCFTLGG